MDNKRRKRIPDEEWEAHKDMIEQLYLKQDKKLEGHDGVIETMERNHFSASKAQFETRLKKWGFHKYTNKDVWQTLSHIVEGRRAQGKESQVLFRGEPWSQGKVQKEIARHRKHKKTISRSQFPSRESHVKLDPAPQVQELPSYVTVRTPPLPSVILPPQTPAGISPSHGGIQSPGTRRIFPSDFAGTLATIFQPSASANQLGTFNSSWSPSHMNLFPHNDGWICQDNVADNFISSDVPNNGWLDYAITGVYKGPTSMESTPLRYSDNVIRGFMSVPDLFTLTASLTWIHPVVQRAIQQINVSAGLSEFTLEPLCQPSVYQLVRRQSFNMRFIHLITSRLVNNVDALDGLKYPQNAVDKLYKTVIEDLFSSGEDILNKLLDSFPVPYSRALEQGIFCAAIELGAVHAVEAILKRGLDPNSVTCNFDEVQYSPLERSCSHLYVDVTRALLGSGANPNKFVHQNPLACCNPIFHKISHQHSTNYGAILDIASLLLGAQLAAPFAVLSDIARECDGETLKRLVTSLQGPSYELFISNKVLATISGREHADGVTFSVAHILSRNYAEGVKTNKIWHQELTASLSNAAFRQNEEVVELLLNAGARPDSDCLIDFVRSENIKIVERLLDRGADANASSAYGPRHLDQGLPRIRTCLIEYTAMSVAISQGFYDAFSLFEKRGFVAKIGHDDIAGLALKAACKRGDAGLVDILLSAQGHLQSYEMDQLITAAIEEGHEALAMKLLKSDIDLERDSLSPTVCDRDGSMLVAASKRGLEGLVGYLLSLPRYPPRYSMGQVITAAIEGGHESIVLKLLESGIRPGHESLWCAVRHRNEPLASLFTNIAHIERRHMAEQMDILREAVMWGEFSIVEGLILAGVPLDDETYPNDMDDVLPATMDRKSNIAWRTTPLSLAILVGDPKIVDLLLASGAQLNVHDPYRDHYSDRKRHLPMTALSASVAMQDLNLCHKLLVLGADPFDNSAIYVAANVKNGKIIDELLEAFTRRYPFTWKPSKKRGFGADALLMAIEKYDIEILKRLVAHTDSNHLVDIHHSDDNRYGFLSPLGSAIERCSVSDASSDILRILLDNGGDPNSIVYEGSECEIKKTALLCAIENLSLRNVQILVKAGARVASKAKWGITRTPLQYAAELGNEAIVQYLLQQGADPNEDPAAWGGATALQLAAIKGYIGIASILLEQKANVNAEPARFEGRTAFEGATEHGRIEMMLLLVQNGADLLSNDRRQYRRAIEFAEKNGQPAAKKFADELCEAVAATSEPGSAEMIEWDFFLE